MPWHQIRFEYETTDISLRRLAGRWGIASKTTLERKIAEEHWSRHQVQRHVIRPVPPGVVYEAGRGWDVGGWMVMPLGWVADLHRPSLWQRLVRWWALSTMALRKRS